VAISAALPRGDQSENFGVWLGVGLV